MTGHDSWTEIAITEGGRAPVSVLDGRTLVETPSGPVPAGSLASGDLVITFDDGPKRLRSVEARRQEDVSRMILVPEGLIGNDCDMLLAPDQLIIVESDAAEALTGSPFAVMPASALEALEGVRRARAARARQLVTLSFVESQAVMAAGGAVLVCEAAAGMPCLLQSQTDRYAPLPSDIAREVVEALEEASWEAEFAARA